MTIQRLNKTGTFFKILQERFTRYLLTITRKIFAYLVYMTVTVFIGYKLHYKLSSRAKLWVSFRLRFSVLRLLHLQLKQQRLGKRKQLLLLGFRRYAFAKRQQRLKK